VFWLVSAAVVASLSSSATSTLVCSSLSSCHQGDNHGLIPDQLSSPVGDSTGVVATVIAASDMYPIERHIMIVMLLMEVIHVIHYE
jgi:hypothetical protein